MIDFRYHIVSLIAVFLALAIGIVLGAGPLREPIGDQLGDQIAELRTEREALRSDLESVQARLDQQNVYLDAAAADILDGTLTGTAVTVVEMPDATSDVTEAALERIEQAGGTVTGRVALTAAWDDPAQEQARTDAAQDVRGSLVPPPALDATPAEVLGDALAQSLVSADPADPSALSADATALYQSLLDAELATETAAVTGPADTVLVVAPAHVAPTDGGTADAAARLQTQLETVGAMALAQPVVLGLRVDDTDLVTAVRDDDTAAAVVTTVDSADQVAGQVSVPLALAASAAGTVGQYGLAPDATAVLPEPVVPASDDEQTEGPTDPDESASP